ncbi:hypothetical protein MTR_4g068400 [Medicago truncatula]|uniref:Uncharacterized protein n=1 Tax=Medicago truncatula TaxID=3880 RepID=G7JEY8_MEDTR|nr:hypothetical protein MTR_4g068400 [Medicago truncatula]
MHACVCGHKESKNVLENCDNIQCLQLEVQLVSFGYLSMFFHCAVVERFTIDFVRRTQRVIMD